MYDLMIIGAGPSGIALAAEAITSGADKEKILVLEKADKNSWIMRKLYPEQKLVTANFKGLSPECSGVMKFYDMQKHEALKVLDETVKKYGINVKHSAAVLKVEKRDGIFHIQTADGEYKSKLAVVAIGVFGKPNKPDYPVPASLRTKTSFDITSTKIERDHVLVVGGGDSAAEYVQHLARAGNIMSISCREETFFRMNPDNRQILEDMARDSNLAIYADSDITSIEDVDERVCVNFKNELLESQNYDHIVYALGGTTPANFLKIAGVDFVDGAAQVADDMESNVKGLYLIGDLTAGKGGGSIVLAFNSGFDAMVSIKAKYSQLIGL